MNSTPIPPDQVARNEVLLEELTREAEAHLHDRYAIGFTNGMKAAVLCTRLKQPISELRARALKAHAVRGQRDLYDQGYLDGLDKAEKILTQTYREKAT